MHVNESTEKRTDNQLDVIVRVEISGSGYSPELEKGLQEDLRGAYSIITRGVRGPAAGPEILVSILVEFVTQVGAALAEEIPSVVVAALLTEVIDKVKGSLRRRRNESLRNGERGCPPPPEGYLANVTVAMSSYDLVITMIPDGETGVDGYDLEELTRRVEGFVRSEAVAGRSVLKITLPNEASYRKELLHVSEGQGSPLIWRVEYRNGDRWPCATYDAENDCFLPAER